MPCSLFPSSILLDRQVIPTWSSFMNGFFRQSSEEGAVSYSRNEASYLWGPGPQESKSASCSSLSPPLTPQTSANVLPGARRCSGQGGAWSGSCPLRLIVHLQPQVLALTGRREEAQAPQHGCCFPESSPSSAHRKFTVVEITQGQNIIGSGFCGERQ